MGEEIWGNCGLLTTWENIDDTGDPEVNKNKTLTNKNVLTKVK